MPERHVALHRSGSAKPPRRRAGLLKSPSECGSSRVAAKSGEGSPGRAAESSPFSEVPPKTDCQPEVRLAVRLGPRADADLSARRLHRTGPLPPDHGLLATPGRERRSGPKLSRTLHSRDGRNPSTEYASRQQAPPICSPLTKQVQNIATQTEIIRMRLRPLKPGVMPPLQRRRTIVANPVVATKCE